MSENIYGEIANPIQPAITMTPREHYEQVIAKIADAWRVGVDDIRGNARHWPIIDARMACYDALAKEGVSITRIGRLLHRDPSSVSHGLRVLRKRNGGQG